LVDDVVDAAQNVQPARLSAVQVRLRVEAGEGVVIRVGNHARRGAFEVVPPGSKGCHDSETLLKMNREFGFRWRETPREEGERTASGGARGVADLPKNGADADGGGGVRRDVEGKGRVRGGEDVGGSEEEAEGREGGGTRRGPHRPGVESGEGVEGGGHEGKPRDESTVIVTKPQELHQLRHRAGPGPGGDGGQLLRGAGDAGRRDDVAQKGDGRLAPQALRWLQEEASGAEAAEDVAKVGGVGGDGVAKHQDIIEIHEDAPVDQGAEDFRHG
jgi:hypothetical protein